MGLSPVQGSQLNAEYFDLDYELTEWLDDAEDPSQYPASAGVIFTDGTWSMRAFEIHVEIADGE